MVHLYLKSYLLEVINITPLSHLELQYYLYIMPTLGLCHFLALWRGGIMAREVI